MQFEWDTNKEKLNLEKHGVSFSVAVNLLLQKHYKIRSDQKNEIRYLAIGELHDYTFTVVYTEREERCRIISARRASKNEEKIYREHYDLL